MQQSTYSAEGSYLAIISGMGCRTTMFNFVGIINSVDFLNVRVDNFDSYGVACACTTRLAIQGSYTCMSYIFIYFMHYQRPLTADIETLARTMSITVEGRSLYSHDRTALRQDKQLRDNELVVDQSNLTGVHTSSTINAASTPITECARRRWK